jgi:hypothetical protein
VEVGAGRPCIKRKPGMKSSDWNKKRNVESRNWKACVCGISTKETWGDIIVGERVDLG